MKNKVLRAVGKHNMLSYGDRLTVGLSGGADSVSLLCILLELREEYGLILNACHINHCLRGEQSDADEAFVRQLCESKNVPLSVFRIDVGALAAERKIGLEECGRQVRYECFAKCGEKVATAHNACDNSETVLLNLTRGASLTGLRGIPPLNKKKGLTIIRPLIYCTREEIESYLKEINQDFVTDKSNFEPVYNRNLIRLCVIPELKKINPAFENAILRMNESVSDDAELLDDIARKAKIDARLSESRYSAEALSLQKKPILSRICASFLWERGVDPTGEKIGYITDVIKNSTKKSLGGGWFADCKNGELALYNESDFSDFEYPLTEGILRLNKGKSAKIFVINREEFDKIGESEAKYLYHTLDYDKILSQAVVRNRRDGDTVKLHGRGFAQKLKKLFCEFVPLEERDSRILIADSEGLIFVEGFGTAERTRVTAKTSKILCIDIKE